MFIQYTYIAPEHHVALESSIRNHNDITAPVLAKLYKSALANVEKQTVATDASHLTSHLKSDKIAVGTATDAKTGIFVQLAQTSENSRLLLTVGVKWAMEMPNLSQGNVATKLW